MPLHRGSRLLLAFLLVGAAAAPAPAYADDPTSATLSVTPPTFEADADPGQTVTETVTVTNDSNAARRIDATVQDFQAVGEHGQAALCSENCAFPIASWMSVQPAQATVGVRSRQDFQVRIAVPKGAGPGGHFGAVVLTPHPTDAPGVRVVGAVTSLVLLRVSGAVHESASLASFRATAVPASANEDAKPHARFGHGPVGFAARVRNDGNVQVRAGGTIDISNARGKRVATIVVPEQRVLPGSIRELRATWDAGRLTGPYTAELHLTYGDTHQTLIGSARFWGLPWWAYVVVVALIVLLLLVLVWLLKHRAKKTLPNHATPDGSAAS